MRSYPDANCQNRPISLCLDCGCIDAIEDLLHSVRIPFYVAIDWCSGTPSK
jgi:hypothetical protein